MGADGATSGPAAEVHQRAEARAALAALADRNAVEPSPGSSTDSSGGKRKRGAGHDGGRPRSPARLEQDAEAARLAFATRLNAHIEAVMLAPTLEDAAAKAAAFNVWAGAMVTCKRVSGPWKEEIALGLALACMIYVGVRVRLATRVPHTPLPPPPPPPPATIPLATPAPGSLAAQG